MISRNPMPITDAPDAQTGNRIHPYSLAEVRFQGFVQPYKDSTQQLFQPRQVVVLKEKFMGVDVFPMLSAITICQFHK